MQLLRLKSILLITLSYIRSGMSVLEKKIHLEIKNFENTYEIWDSDHFTYIHASISLVLAWDLAEKSDWEESLGT